MIIWLVVDGTRQCRGGDEKRVGGFTTAQPSLFTDKYVTGLERVGWVIGLPVMGSLNVTDISCPP